MPSRLASDFVNGLVGNRPLPSLEIHPADEMYRYGLQSLRGSEDAAAILYFEKGRQIADTFAASLAWRFGPRGPDSVLDFAAGFGRATRFFAAEFPAAEVWVAEIDPEAVRFQERSFGVRGIVSTAEPNGFRPERCFDAVVAASFFSHVPAGAFEEWLRVLWRIVRPGGLLLLSTHGPDLFVGPADWSEGLVFRPESETQRLDPNAYGTSWATRDFIEWRAGRATEGEAAFSFVPHGLCGHQDVTLLSKPPGIPAGPPILPLPPRGELDGLEVLPGMLCAEGWVEGPGKIEIAFFVGNAPRARTAPDGTGPRRRWRFEITREGIGPDDVLRVAAAAGRLSNTLAMGTLRGVGVIEDGRRL